MKRFLRVFELTVAEQRVIVVLLLCIVAFVAVKAFRGTSGSSAYPTPSPSAQPAP